MTDDPSGEPDTSEPRLMLDIAESLFQDTLAAFEKLKVRILNEQNVTQSDVSGTMSRLVLARLALIREIQSYEKRILIEDGLAPEAPIDFDEIRRDIGCRLDGLRDARGTASVPEQSAE